ncbi:MAG: hypothetical protein WKF58_19140 [Ilumatobacteraceae bacterium]
MRMRSPVLGLVVITVALGVSELVDGLFAAGRSPVVSVAEAFVDLTPAWLKDWGIRTFGTADKVVLVVAVVAVVAIVAVCIGVLATRRLGLPALATTLAIGAVGCLAVLSRPGASAASTLPTIAGTVAALGVLRWYWRGPGSLRHATGRRTGAGRAVRPAFVRHRFAHVRNDVTCGRRHGADAGATLRRGRRAQRTRAPTARRCGGSASRQCHRTGCACARATSGAARRQGRVRRERVHQHQR